MDCGKISSKDRSGEGRSGYERLFSLTVILLATALNNAFTRLLKSMMADTHFSTTYDLITFFSIDVYVTLCLCMCASVYECVCVYMNVCMHI